VHVSSEYSDDRLFVLSDGRRLGTPLLVALLAVGGADLMFALDSIPAIFSVTQDPFLVYTSNAFAVLGMTGLYFLLASVVDRFRFLKLGLAVVLAFIGAKLSLSGVFEISTGVSLLVVVGVVGASILASLFLPAGAHKRPLKPRGAG
jgi:tellurite resistance protein TerC